MRRRTEALATWILTSFCLSVKNFFCRFQKITTCLKFWAKQVCRGGLTEIFQPNRFLETRFLVAGIYCNTKAEFNPALMQNKLCCRTSALHDVSDCILHLQSTFGNSQLATLDKINGKFRSPVPQSKMGKWRVCSSRGFILYFGGWRFAVPFYSVQDSSYQELAGSITANQKKAKYF